MGVNGWALAADLLSPLAHLLANPDVTELVVAADGRHVSVHRHGEVIRYPDLSVAVEKLKAAIDVIAKSCHKTISRHQPMLEAGLEDGSRVTATIPPVARDGTRLIIRRHARALSLDDLVASSMLDATAAHDLTTAVAERQTILISGASNTGKTTLLSALANTIPTDETIVVIEETTEIRVAGPNVFRHESRPAASDDAGHPLAPITLEDLLRHALRLTPDRILLGEVRGAEASTLVELLNTGHPGSLSTIHANNATHSLKRLRHLAGPGWEPEAIEDAIDLVVYLKRVAGRRRVVEIYDVKADRLRPVVSTPDSAYV